MPTTNELAESEEIELEPASDSQVPGVQPAGSPAAPGPTPAVALVDKSIASLSSETDTLRRSRLLAAAACLAAAFGVLCVWVFLSDNPGTLTAGGSRYSIRVGLIGLRYLLSVAVAGVLASKVPLTHKGLRIVEYVLFLGLTLLLIVSQYFVGLDLIHRGPDYMPVVLAFVKDGVIQMLALMMIYGTLETGARTGPTPGGHPPAACRLAVLPCRQFDSV